MKTSEKSFVLETNTYGDYKLWDGDWELINGHPQALSPSPKYTHQKLSLKFSSQATYLLAQCNKDCKCEVLYELDWIINDNTIVRPDCMVVNGEVRTDYLAFAPTLILEISSPATRMKDRNTKYNLYEMCGVKYYIIADAEKKTAEVFELVNGIYKNTNATLFSLTDQCGIQFNVENLF